VFHDHLSGAVRMGEGDALEVVRRLGLVGAVHERADQFPNQGARLIHQGLELPQTVADGDLFLGEVGAEREGRKIALCVPALDLSAHPRRQIAPEPVGDAIPRVDLAGPLRDIEQLVLESRVGDVQQSLDDLLIAARAQIGDAVLGDDEVAQVAWDGAVSVAGDDVRRDAWRADR